MSGVREIAGRLAQSAILPIVSGLGISGAVSAVIAELMFLFRS